jgi:phosphoribosylanthranilate isomerase
VQEKIASDAWFLAQGRPRNDAGGDGMVAKRVKVKICGITNVADAQAAVKAGCDALGFAFFNKSPRYIIPQEASEIIYQLPKGVMKIGVFCGAKEKEIKQIAKLCKLDILQFHGDETVAFCRKFKNFKVIKVFRVKDTIDVNAIKKYNTFAYLFDTYVKSKKGGTGKTFNWEVLKYLHEIKQPIFLSGGLDARNVCKAIAVARPDWVDVCSSIELRPGKKDHGKVKRFIRAAKRR